MSEIFLSERCGFLVSCCSIALREESVFEAVEQIAAAGFASVEIWHPHVQALNDEALRELAARCSSLGVSIPVIAPYFSFTRGPQAVGDSLRTAEKALHAASILGAKKIRTFVDIGRDGLPSARAGEGDWRAACEGLACLCALDASVEFVLETHENTLADTVPSIRRIFDEVAAPNLRLNFQINRDFLARGYMACLRELFPVMSHMHWQQIRADETHTYLEEAGIIDFRAIIALLQSRRYAGTVSVEYCWSPVETRRLPSAGVFLQACLEGGRSSSVVSS